MSDRGTTLYNRWQSMLQRCSNKNNPSYKYYGGRGIKVCEEWRAFDNYKKWALSSGFDPALTIDRIDNDGNYEPGNCRWATPKQQRANQRVYRNAKLNPEAASAIRADKRSHPEIAKDYGVSRSMITHVKLNTCWPADE